MGNAKSAYAATPPEGGCQGDSCSPLNSPTRRTVGLPWSSSRSASPQLSNKAELASVLDGRPHTIISAAQCGYCDKVKDVLIPGGKGKEKFNIVECDALGGARCGRVMGAVRDKYDHHTFPVVFINGEFQGGYSDVVASKKRGTLRL